MRPTLNTYQFTFFLGNRQVLTLPALEFSLTASQNSQTNEDLFFTFFLILIGRMCSPSRIPKVYGVALDD
jgi:hypothetical protein